MDPDSVFVTVLVETEDATEMVVVASEPPVAEEPPRVTVVVS